MKFAVLSSLAALALGLQSLHAEPLAFAKTELTVEAPLGEKSVVARFPFTNSSSQPAKIVRSESECSCMTLRTAENKWTYGPGEAGVLEGVFEIGNYQGTVEKTIKVWLEGDPGDKPSSLLRLKVVISDLVQIEPKTLQWAVGQAPEAKTARLTFHGEKPRAIRRLTSSDPNFTYTIQEISPGKIYDVTVTCTNAQTRAMSVMKIETDGEVGGPRTVQFFAVVK